MKRGYQAALIYSVLCALMPNVSATDMDVSINQVDQLPAKSKETKVSYYTVKDYTSLYNAIETAKSGDVIIVVGNDIDSEGSGLTIKNKELTIVSDNRMHAIKLGYIYVENGTLNLGVPGTKSASRLNVKARFVLKDSNLNLYDGACIDGADLRDVKRQNYGCGYYGKVNDFNDKYLVDARNTTSNLNLCGGYISNNHYCGLIKDGKKLSLNIEGTKLANNYLYGNHGYESDLKDFIFKSGSLEGSSLSISAENSNISGGTLNLPIKTKNAIVSGDPKIANLSIEAPNATISGNPSIDDLSFNSATISGGTFKNVNANANVKITGGNFKTVKAKSVTLSGDVSISELKADKITVDGPLGENSKICVSLNNYNINDKRKVFNVSNGVEIRDVFHNFKLPYPRYFVNNKGYLDDTPSYKYQLTDDSTGIIVESDNKITGVKSGDGPKATFTIYQPKDSDEENVYHLNFYVDGKLLTSDEINNVAIYVPYMVSKLDLNKLDGVKIYDSNNEKMINCKKTVKSIDGNLYYLLTISDK